MKRFFKNRCLFIFLFSVIGLVLLCTAGCSDKPGGKEPGDTDKEITLILDKAQATLILGDEIWIKATYTELEGETLSWSSDNESVATVQDGKVSANAVGNATIQASYADKVATCAVTVS
ncbi:MAG: Ig domain-containing protein, partial [Candidatus Scatosoma sp.]